MKWKLGDIEIHYKYVIMNKRSVIVEIINPFGGSYIYKYLNNEVIGSFSFYTISSLSFTT